jgi:hypothetical protein
LSGHTPHEPNFEQGLSYPTVIAESDFFSRMTPGRTIFPVEDARLNCFKHACLGRTIFFSELLGGKKVKVTPKTAKALLSPPSQIGLHYG